MKSWQKAMFTAGAAGLIAGGVAQSAQAEMVITEWMYSGDGGEFVEFTNIGSTAIDMTGWVYDDDSGISSPVDATGGDLSGLDLSSFGVVAAGESVIISEVEAATFRANWGLLDSVKVIGLYANNLGRGDRINLFDQTGTLVDSLTYADNGSAGGPRTQNASGNPGSAVALGADDVTQWVLATVGDEYNSYAATSGDIGNPGTFVPEPGSLALMGLGGLAFLRRRRNA